jgi:predicted N-acetyltransferase YhbS
MRAARWTLTNAGLRQSPVETASFSTNAVSTESPNQKQMHFALDRSVSLDEFRDLLIRSTLSERRPIDDLACLQGMLDNSDIVATCLLGERLIGIARSVTDYHYSCYLSDLAVDRDFQSQGVGSRLISLTQSKLGPKCKIILLSAPGASQYYPHIGFQQHSSAWVLPRDREIKSKP